MPVQIIITGEHATDVLAELQNLNKAMGGEITPTVQLASDPKIDQSPSNTEAKSINQEKPKIAPKQEKLSRKEQDKAADEMIKAGQKDERFDLLTKNRQKQVEDELANREEAVAENGASAEVKPEDDLSDMFDEDEALSDITADDIRALMGELGKDAQGEQDQDKLIKIRDVLSKHIPEGSEIKVGNIPSDKITTVYDDLKKLQG